MPGVSIDETVGQLLTVLREAFEGPPEGGSYFTDNNPDAGLFGTLSKLSAAEASEERCKTTVAAHAHHLVFSLEASSAWIRGDRSPRNWKESWQVGTVDADAWTQLQKQLRAGYEDLRTAIQSNARTNVDAMGGAIGAIAHMAYHLGAVRQKVSYKR